MKKRFLIVSIILLIVCLSIGSYALWKINETQNTFNTLGSKCFELTLMEETEGVRLNKAYPISDEEGLNTTGYSFKVKNICDTYAVYSVNLEDILLTDKRIANEYIKVSLNNGTPKLLNSNEKTTPTIENADTSFRLTSSSLAPESEETYNLKIWLDEETPPLKEVMQATFESKVSIVAGYIEEENLVNNIETRSQSKNIEYSNIKEIVEIEAISEKYELIEYSFDNSIWTSITPSKEIIIEKEYKEEGNKKIYFKDEVGNIKESEIETSKLDQTPPEITFHASDIWEQTKDISLTFEDSKSGLKGYAITNNNERPTEWIPLEGNETTKIYNTIKENFYVWTIDNVDNINYKEITNIKVDTLPPSPKFNVTIQNNSFTVNASESSDTHSGISNYYFSLDNVNWASSKETEKTYSNLSDGNHSIYFKVEDNVGKMSDVISKVVGIAYENVYVSEIGNDSNFGTKENPVASIKKAYTQVKNNGTITLLSDITETTQADFNIANKETTIKSDSGNIYSVLRGSSLTSNHALSLSNSNTVNLTSLIYDANSVETSTRFVNVSDNSTLNVLDNATLKGTNGTGATIYYTSGTTVNVNGGTVQSNTSNSLIGEGTLNIYENSIVSNTAGNGYPAIYIGSPSAVVNVYGGNIDSTVNAIYVDAGTVNISGGNIHCSSATGYTIYNRRVTDESYINITGGNIASDNSVALYNSGIASISGNPTITSNATNNFTIRNTSQMNMSGITIHSQNYINVANNGTLEISDTTLIADNNRNINNSGTLKLKANTNIINNSASSYAIYNSNQLEIDGATITSNTYRGIYNTTDGNLDFLDGILEVKDNIALYNLGRFELTGGSFTSNKGITTITNTESGIGIIDGITINNIAATNAVVYNMGTLEMKSGSILAKKSGSIYNGGSLTVTGGSITSDESLCIYNTAAGIATINGGSLTAKVGNVINNLGTVNIGESAHIESLTVQTYPCIGSSKTLNITGGTILSGDATNIATKETGTTTISGGLINTTYNYSINNVGKVYIMGSADIRSANTYTVNNNGILEMSGGTVENTTYRPIYNGSAGVATFSGGRIITSNFYALYNNGTAIINGTSFFQNNSATYATIYSTTSATLDTSNITNATIQNLGGGETIKRA